MPADSANADIQLARLIVQKRLATPDQVKQAMMAAVAHPQKPGLLKMMVSRKLITPDQAKQLQAALGGGGATSSAAAKPAQKKKPAGGLEFADDDEDALPTGPTAAQMLGGRLLVDDVGLADADDDDELEIPDDIGDLEIPDDALPASSGSGGGKKKRKKKKPVAADDDIAVMKAPPGPTLDCINCRHKNPPKSRSCNRCGAPLDPSKLKGRPEELGVQRFAWVKPLLGLLAIGGIVYALYANGLIGGGGSSNSNAPRNTGGGDKARNVATNTPTTAADELVAAAPGVRNGEMIRVRGVLQSQRSYQLTILTPHGTEVTINHRGRPTGWLGEYATKPERFADKPLEFVGELFWRPGNTPVVNKATLSAEGFWIDDGSGFDFLLDADAPEPKVEGGPGASADPSDPADPGDPADPLDPADPSTPGIPDLPPPSEYLQGLWADVLAIGPQSEADTKDADRVKKWNTMTRQLRRMSEVAYIPLALDWLDANPAPAIDQSSKYVPAVDGELWGAVLKGVAMHRGRRPWGERIGKAMEAAMPRYPQWVAESIGQATLDPMAVTRVALWAAEPDDGVSSEMLKARNAARNAVMTQLTQLRDRDVVIPLMRKLANAPHPGVRQRAVDWLATVNPLAQIPTMAEWVVGTDSALSRLAADRFKGYVNASPEIKAAALSALSALIVADDGSLRPVAIETMLTVDPAGTHDALWATMARKDVPPESMQAMTAMFDRAMVRNAASFAAEVLPDATLADPYRLWALAQLRKVAETSGGSRRDEFVQLVLNMLDNADDPFNPHPALVGMCRNRPELADRFIGLLGNPQRRDANHLIDRLAECDPDRALTFALQYVLAADAPSNGRARALDLIAAAGSEAQLRPIVDALGKDEKRLGPELTLSLRRQQAIIECAALEAKGGLTRDVTLAATLPSVSSGQRGVATCFNTNGTDWLVAATAQRDEFVVTRVDNGEVAETYRVNRRASSMAFDRYESVLATWESAPRATRGPKPQPVPGVRPGISAVLYAWFSATKAVTLFTADGRLEQWDFDNAIDLNPYVNATSAVCSKVTDIRDQLPAWPAGLTAEKIAVGTKDHVAAIRVDTDGNVAFVDLQKGSLKGTVAAGHFTTMRMAWDGSLALFVGDGPVRVAFVGRDKEARVLWKESPEFDHAYIGLRCRSVYLVTPDRIRVLDAESGEESISMVPTLPVDQAYRMENGYDGRFIIESSRQKLVIRKVNTSYVAEFVAALKGAAEIYQLVVGEDGRQLVVATAERSALLYRLR